MAEKSPLSLIRILVIPGVFILSLLILSSCTRKTVAVGSQPADQKGVRVTGPACIIYKTRGDYSKYVPVELTADGARISSFPDVADVYMDGKLALPTPLAGGYLLDNRGIGPNVAFLSITYEEYSRMKKTPSSDELFSKLLVKDPLLEMYQCGKRNEYSDIPKDLDELISSGKLKGCKKLK
jgi:hypothetical protein